MEMSRRGRSKLTFQADHLSSVRCDVSAITPEMLLGDFMRKSSNDVNVPKSIICDIVVESQDVVVVDKNNKQEIERWSFQSIRSCKAIPVQPAVFPNRYSNVISIISATEIHLFNVLNNDAAKVAELLNAEITLKQPAEFTKSLSVNRDYGNVDFALESMALNRCFDDIENIFNRMQQNRIEFQKFSDKWNESSGGNRKKKSSKDDERRRAAELAAIRANQIRPEEMMDTLQKLKLAFIIVGRIRFSLQSGKVTATQYVNMLYSPLAAIVTTTNQAPLSPNPFDFVKSVDAPLFRRDVIAFIHGSLTQPQVEFWKQFGEAWNLPLEEWKLEVRPYRPVFRPDNHSPYLPFLDPAVIAISLANAKEESVSEDGTRTTEEPNESDRLAQNAAYGLIRRTVDESDSMEDGFSPNATYGIVRRATLESDRLAVTHAVVEQVDSNVPLPPLNNPEKPQSVSSDSHPPLEIQELDDVIAAADVVENSIRIRPISDEKYIGGIFSQNKRAVRAKIRHRANDLTELSVEEGEVVEVIDVAGNSYVIRNVFGESGHAPVYCFEEIPYHSTEKLEPSRDSAYGKASESDAASKPPSVKRSSVADTHDPAVKKSSVAESVKDDSPSRSSASQSSTAGDSSKESAIDTRKSAVAVASSTSSDSASSPNSSKPTFEQQVFASLLKTSSSKDNGSETKSTETVPENSAGHNHVDMDKVSDTATASVIFIEPKKREPPVAEPVPMKPKALPTRSNLLPLPDKDYDDPTWLLPAKQNLFAAEIKKAGGRVVRVVRARDAQRSEELTIFVDEILELLETPAGAWWQVINAVGRVGYVPLTYVEEMEFVEPAPVELPKAKPITDTRSQKNVVISTQAQSAESIQQAIVIEAKDKFPSSVSENVADSPAAPRLPTWAQSQPELVIVEHQPEWYKDALSRRRGSHDSTTKPQFGAPLLVPFSNKTGNSRFDEARQKTASMLSLMISSQVTKVSALDANASTLDEPLIKYSPDSSSTDIGTAESVALSDVSMRLTISSADKNGNNSCSAADDSMSYSPAVISDVAYRSITVASNVTTDSGVFIKQQTPRSVAARPNDLRHVRENMERVTDQLNLLAASGKLGPRKSIAPLVLRGKTKKDNQNSRLRPGAPVEEIRTYLMKCGFSIPLVQEYGNYDGDELLSMTKLEDFERPHLPPTEVKRLFNLVQGARALGGLNVDRSAKEEFENKVINRRAAATGSGNK